MNRRKFLQGISTAVVVFNTKSVFATDLSIFENKKPVLRFAVASDFHYAQPKTAYQEMLDTALTHIRAAHAADPFEFCVFNGDLVHDDISHIPTLKTTFDQLPFKYFVTQGNHDTATKEEWESGWQTPLNFDHVIGNNVLLFATTSNKQGKYLPPDIDWLGKKFEEHKNAKHIFLFIHIPPIKWTANGIDSPEFQSLVKKQKNLKAVFHGHEHDQDGIKWQDDIPYIFDSHIGGNWGTSYRGYRIVELYKNGSMLTYIMNPTEKINIAEV
jgi:Icc protein